MSDTPNAPIVTGDVSKDDLERQKLELEVMLKRKELTAKKSWWLIVGEVLGIPAVVVTIVLGITAASGNRATERKTTEEILQIRHNLARAAEAGALANDLLSAKQKEGPKAFEQAVAQNTDRIRDALKSLQRLEEQSARINVQRSVLKFVLLWILFSVIGLIFDVINKGWHTATSTMLFGFHVWANRETVKEDDDEVGRRERERLRRRRNIYSRVVPVLATILSPLPDILRWSIQLSIFTTLLGPLFNEIAVSLGSNITFAVVLTEGRHLHFAKMLSLMRDILFSGSMDLF